MPSESVRIEGSLSTDPSADNSSMDSRSSCTIKYSSSSLPLMSFPPQQRLHKHFRQAVLAGMKRAGNVK